MSKLDRKRKKESKRKERKQAEKRERAKATIKKEALLGHLFSVFGEHSAEFIELASKGMSPEEIAATLDVSTGTVSEFIDAFVSLPGGLDHKLLSAPWLLAKRASFQSMIKSALSDASATRRR